MMGYYYYLAIKDCPLKHSIYILDYIDEQQLSKVSKKVNFETILSDGDRVGLAPAVGGM